MLACLFSILTFTLASSLLNAVKKKEIKFEQAVSVNLIGAFNAVRLAAAAMAANAPNIEGERGVIVNTASIAADDGQIGQCAYAASKAGVAGMTLPLARDLARYGIRVVTIAPGVFDTPMMQDMPDKLRQSHSNL